MAAQEPRPAVRRVREPPSATRRAPARPHGNGARPALAAAGCRSARRRAAHRAHRSLPPRCARRLPEPLRGLRAAADRGNGLRMPGRVVVGGLAPRDLRRRRPSVRSESVEDIVAAVEDVLAAPASWGERGPARAAALHLGGDGARPRRGLRRAGLSATSAASSASTSSRTSSSKPTDGVQPSRSRALDGSPTRSCSSAAPRWRAGSLRTCRRQSRPTCAKAHSTSSRDGVALARSRRRSRPARRPAASATSRARSRRRSPSRAARRDRRARARCSSPSEIAAAARATLRGRKSSGRRGDSWL